MNLEISKNAANAVSQCTAKSIGITLNSLTCSLCKLPNGSTDLQSLQKLRGVNTKAICAMVFKKGDIVWTCRQCGKDTTCVQCDTCFKNSNHEGHDVYFHKSSGLGGCCDCGDVEAWASAGDCCNHGKKVIKSDFDPSEQLSPELSNGLNAVLMGLMQVFVCYAAGITRGFQSWDHLDYVNPAIWPEDTILHMYLHNDDKHTYNDVSGALRACGFTVEAAAAMTEAVDNEGQRHVMQGKASEVKKYYDNIVAKAGLLACIIPDEVDALTPRFHAIFVWLNLISEFHEGVKRFVTLALLKDFSEYADIVSNPFNGAEISAGIRKLCINEWSSDLAQFPMKLPLIDGYLPGVDDQCEYKARVVNPILFDPNFPKNALSILILASPFLPKSIQLLHQTMVMSFQHDSVFKFAFSQIFMLCYPYLNALYYREIGTENESILNMAVQVFTADSVVNLLSSCGVSLRPFEERSPLSVSRLLIQGLIGSLVDMGCPPVFGADSILIDESKASLSPEKREKLSILFLENHAVVNHKIRRIMQAIRYITTTPTVCAELLAGIRDFGMVDDWLSVCHLLQNFFTLKRETGAHVYEETIHWQTAVNLVLDIDGLSRYLSTSALYPIENNYYSNLAHLDSLSNGIIMHSFRKTIIAIRNHYCVGNKNLCSDVFLKPLAGCEVFVPNFLSFEVSGDRVSISIPLHRFLGNLVIAAVRGGVSLATLIAEIAQEDFYVSIIEYPLQCLSFIAQGYVGMWKRNGNAIPNLVYNYSRVPLCQVLRDVDLIALQFGVVCGDMEKCFAIMVERFEVPLSFVKMSGASKDYFPSLCSEFLKIIILMVTYAPMIFGKFPLQSGLKNELEENDEGLLRALQRSIVHHVLNGLNTTSKLLSKKKSICVSSVESLPDTVIVEAIQSVCMSNGADKSTATMELCPFALEYFNPENMFVSERERVLDNFLLYRKKDAAARKADNLGENLRRRSPIIHKNGLPNIQKAFLPLRAQFLFQPLFINYLTGLLNQCPTFLSKKQQKVSDVICKILHLVTIQVHCSSFAAVQLFESSDCASKHCAMFFTPLFDRIFNDHIENAISKTSSGSETEVIPVADIEYCKALWQLFLSLTKIWSQKIIDEDGFYDEGFEWIFQELSERSIVVKAYLETNTCLSFASLEAIQEALREAQKAKKESAQKRLLGRINQLAAQFQLPDDISDDECEENLMSKTAEVDEQAEIGMENGLPTDTTCILCKQKKQHDRIGFFSYLQPSRAISNVLDNNCDCPGLNDVYRVVSLEGCDVYANPTLTPVEQTQHIIGHINQSEHVLIDHRAGVWVHLVSPVRGWAQVYQQSYKYRDLGNSTESAYSKTRMQITTKKPILYKVKSLQYSIFGSARLHITSCMHVVHFSCYDEYYSKCLANAFGGGYFQDVLLDVKNNVLPCPLCKSLTNAILPFSPALLTPRMYSKPSAAEFNFNAKLFSTIPKFIFANCDSVESTPPSLHHYTSFAEACVERGLIECHNGFEYSERDIPEESLFQAKTSAKLFRNENDCLSKVANQSKALYCLWSAVGYTVLSNLSAVRWGNQNNNQLAFLHQLFLCCRGAVLSFGGTCKSDLFGNLRANPLKFEGNLFGKLLSRKLFKLFFPVGVLSHYDRKRKLETSSNSGCFRILDSFTMISSCQQLGEINSETIQESDSVLARLPCQTVSNSLFPDNSRVNCVLELFTLRNKLLLNSCKCEGMDENLVVWYPVFYKPLLSQDLNTLVIAVVSLAETSEEVYEWIQITIFARICQVLLEPISVDAVKFNENISTFNGISSQETLAACTALHNLREFILNTAEMKLTSILSKERLYDLVVDSTLPFLQYCFSLSTNFSNMISTTSNLPLNFEVKMEIPSKSFLEFIEYFNLGGVFRELSVSKCDFTEQNVLTSMIYKWVCDYARVFPNAACEGDANVSDDLFIPRSDSNAHGADLGDDLFGEFNDEESVEMDDLFGVESESSIKNGLNETVASFYHLAEKYQILKGGNEQEQTVNYDLDLTGYDPHYCTVDECMGDMFSILNVGYQLPIASAPDGKSPLLPLFQSRKEISRSVSCIHSGTPLQGSLNGCSSVYGLHGETLTHRYFDLSHYGLGIRHVGRFIKLPRLYTDLYQIMKFPIGRSGPCVEEPILCLVCGKILYSGSKNRDPRAADPLSPGECTLHAQQCGCGVGVFLHVQKCCPLLICGPRSCYFPAIYADSNGESLDGQFSSKPMYLLEDRVKKLESMYFNHQIPVEVYRNRITSTRNIRMNWY